MTAARVQIAWEHTSALMAHLANCHRDTKKRPQPYTAAQFNPYPGRRQREQAVDEVPISFVAGVFLEK